MPVRPSGFIFIAVSVICVRRKPSEPPADAKAGIAPGEPHGASKPRAAARNGTTVPLATPGEFG
ncbi:hypothetical protein GCM10011326_17900 [Salipiger profundus]|nr:hypothetical protein GCM10011326_17900 [Salipiger profundus]